MFATVRTRSYLSCGTLNFSDEGASTRLLVGAGRSPASSSPAPFDNADISLTASPVGSEALRETNCSAAVVRQFVDNQVSGTP